MTISFRAIIVAAIATSVVTLHVAAQDAPAAPATNVAEKAVAPAKKTEAKKTTAKAVKPAKKPEAKPDFKVEPVLSPEPAVAKQNVNVRGQSSINSEVIASLKKGDHITVLEDITLKKPKQDEPARWYRIALPTNTTVWINTAFIEEGKVKPRRLNLRGGPGENFSILGRLDRGTPVKTIETKAAWTRIEPPTNAFGFVAAHLVERTPGAAIAATPPVTPPVVTPPPATVAEVTPATTPIVPAEPITPPVVTPPSVAATTPPPPVPTPAPAEAEAPIEKVKKVVNREGILKGSVSIQAPSYYELRSLDTGKTINYIFSPSTNLMLKQYKGKRIVVTGEELLDERWQNTPVLIVDALQTVE
jgi:uncharacterized protein YgiM (DUF1202 family)